MNCHSVFVALLTLLAFTQYSAAGSIYQITSSDGKNEITYEVKFGGGRKFDQMTAYDPASKSFVYLQWERTGTKPEPTGSIWDHKTGETIMLYKFPGVTQPLPIIPTIDDLTICPKTGSKKITKKRTIIFD